jgi:uncharacterized protein YecE (DUF72 family)
VVTSWRDKTPPGFIFAAKVPGVITHEKVLKDCQAEGGGVGPANLINLC